MATAQRIHPAQKKKISGWTNIKMPSEIITVEESQLVVKQLLAVILSAITYMRGLFPESSYRTYFLDGNAYKVLQDDVNCPGVNEIPKWVEGCFQAMERKYLRSVKFTIQSHSNQKNKTEAYVFYFKYPEEGTEMNSWSNQGYSMGISSEVKRSIPLLLEKLSQLIKKLNSLPSNVGLSMKLFYYNDVTPNDYQPLGFQDWESSESLEFNPHQMNMKLISTQHHMVKLKILTDECLENQLDKPQEPGAIEAVTDKEKKAVPMDARDSGENEEKLVFPSKRKLARK
ncbi:HORMA domain-containing protein 2 [Tachyglossus aculeatus]|uniref:HORMA domain-containing protein 2 n=1 Tax=Tachyglossus aculeatus TaxID=9261 RepID=UPI0018F683FB|nr:HORMA domain-containing protein 2 [Tachyglossus aculeatus]